jgi:hypothetical protein
MTTVKQLIQGLSAFPPDVDVKVAIAKEMRALHTVTLARLGSEQIVILGSDDLVYLDPNQS